MPTTNIFKRFKKVLNDINISARIEKIIKLLPILIARDNNFQPLSIAKRNWRL